MGLELHKSQTSQVQQICLVIAFIFQNKAGRLMVTGTDTDFLFHELNLNFQFSKWDLNSHFLLLDHHATLSHAEQSLHSTQSSNPTYSCQSQVDLQLCNSSSDTASLPKTKGDGGVRMEIVVLVKPSHRLE